MLLSIVYLLIQFQLSYEESVKEDKKQALPPCKYIDPYTHLKEWIDLEKTECNYTTVEAELNDEENERYKFGIKSFAFDSFASDRMGLRRDLGDQAHKLCKNTSFISSLSTSVVIIHHNEALSVIIRMIVGIFEKTPSDLLHEIIVYEDASESEHQLTEHLNKLKDIMKYGDRLKIEATTERQGLIRAKVLASRIATGDVLVFLDSHCEVTENWLLPLLAPIEQSPNSIVLPIVDLIHPTTLEYSKAMVAKSGFDWSLYFKWIYLPWEYFDIEENNVKPFESPSMSGGLLAIRTEFFREIGEYDMGMKIWGAENVELSLKAWMCGGRVVVAPCSRIGHIFRMRRPYKSMNVHDSNLYNSARVAKTWLGRYEKYFLKARPKAVGMDIGTLEDVISMRDKLNCHDMDWYIENVYPELKPEEENKKLEEEEEEKKDEL